MTKQKTRIVYRDRPANNYFSLETVKRVKDGIYSFVAILAALWFVAGPFVDAQAGEYLKNQLIQIGMDPATVQALNKNLTDLQETVKQKDGAVDKLSGEVGDLKVDLVKILEKLNSIQQQQMAPAEPVK